MLTEKQYKKLVREMRQRTLRLDREGNYWTDGEREQLRNMFLAGDGITEIASCLGRTEPAVYQQINLMSLYEQASGTKRKKYEPCTHRCHCMSCKVPVEDCPERLPFHERKKVRR